MEKHSFQSTALLGFKVTEILIATCITSMIPNYADRGVPQSHVW
jgi:hypothetical protein